MLSSTAVVGVPEATSLHPLSCNLQGGLHAPIKFVAKRYVCCRMSSGCKSPAELRLPMPGSALTEFMHVRFTACAREACMMRTTVHRSRSIEKDIWRPRAAATYASVEDELDYGQQGPSSMHVGYRGTSVIHPEAVADASATNLLLVSQRIEKLESWKTWANSEGLASLWKSTVCVKLGFSTVHPLGLDNSHALSYLCVSLRDEARGPKLVFCCCLGAQWDGLVPLHLYCCQRHTSQLSVRTVVRLQHIRTVDRHLLGFRQLLKDCESDLC